jgi:riboflavin kinase/FMN adenylyltransferase
MNILIGEVIKGDQRGRELGFPTANLKLSKEVDSPSSSELEDGVYAGIALIIDPKTNQLVQFERDYNLKDTIIPEFKDYSADQLRQYGFATATHVGSKSTFDQTKREYEVHIIGFDADIYYMTVTNFLISKLRGSQKFPSMETLVAQIQQDVQQAKELTIQE